MTELEKLRRELSLLNKKDYDSIFWYAVDKRILEKRITKIESLQGIIKK